MFLYIFNLCDLGIDFLPVEVIKGNKTTGWLGAKYSKVNKFLPYIWCNFDSLINKKFDNLSMKRIEYTSKMYTT